LYRLYLLLALNCYPEKRGCYGHVNNGVCPEKCESASIAATLYAYLRRLGTPLDDMDLLIAGIAIENDMTLVTHNMKHFSRIPGLKLQDWIE